MSTERLITRRARAVLSAAFLVCCAAAPATAAGDGGGSAGQKIADALEESPVYVDPSYESAVPAGKQRQLVDQIEQSGIPVKVVLVPLVEGDAWGGESKQLVGVLRDRMGVGARDEKPVFLTTGETGPEWLSGYEGPGETYQARDAAAVVGFEKDMEGRGLAARVSRAVDILEAGDGSARYEKATAGLRDKGPAGGGEPGTPYLWPALTAAVAAVAGALLVVSRRRAAAAISSPPSVFAAAREADEQGLRGRAEDEVLRFGEELSAAEPAGDDASAALRLALDAYAAAGSVLDEADGVPDLAGVLALVAEGRDALRDATAPPPRGRLRKRPRPADRTLLCFFHPLHGRAAGRVRWRPLGRREGLRVAACEACASAVAEHRAPEALTGRYGNRDVPYFQIPPEQSLWSATGYGSVGEGTLTARVARGDFSRTAAARRSATVD